jgi:hypothetical protein
MKLVHFSPPDPSDAAVIQFAYSINIRLGVLPNQQPFPGNVVGVTLKRTGRVAWTSSDI